MLFISINQFPSPGPFMRHVSTDWQIASDPFFENIIDESLNDHVNLLSYISSLTDVTTESYVRVRMNLTTGRTNWSNVTSCIGEINAIQKPDLDFTCDIEIPDTPDITGDGDYTYSYPPVVTTTNNVVTIDDGFFGTYSGLGTPVANGITEPVIDTPVTSSSISITNTSTINSSPFTLLVGSDTHKSTSWYLYHVDSNPEVLIWQSVNDTVNLETISFNLPSGSTPLGAYEVRVSYTGASNAESSLSVESVTVTN